MNRIGLVRHARAFIVVATAVVVAGAGAAAAAVGSAPAGAALTAASGTLGLPSLADASQYILAPSSRTVHATKVTESTPVDDDYVQAGNQVSEVNAHQLNVGTSTTTQTDDVTVRQAGVNQPGGYFSYVLHAPAGQPVTIRVEEAGSATSDYWVLVNGTKVYHREPQPKQSGVWDGLAGLVHYQFTVPAKTVGGNEFTLTFQNSGTPGDGAQIAAVWASTARGTPQSPYGGTAANATTSGAALTSNLFGKPYEILDFGHEVGGQVQFTARSSGQATIGLAFSESWEYMTSASDFSEDPAGVATETHYLNIASGTSQVTDPVIRGGFRYLMVFLDSPGTVKIENLTLHFTPDPTATNLRAYQGSFLSSDVTLNKLWYAGAYTLQMDTIDPTTGRAYPAEPGEVQNDATIAQGPTAITDGAKRDRLDWVGDQSVEDPVAYLTTGNQQAALDSLEFMAEGANSDGQIPGVYLPSSGYNDGWGEYAAWWVRNYWTYYLYSGDKATLDKWFPAMQKDVAWLTSLVGSNGLLNVPGGESGQWGYGNSGEETYENALYVWTLQAAEQVADAEGDQSLAAQYTADAATTTAAVNANLWDAAAGAYIVEPGNTAHPQDGNVMAVLAGIATGQRATDVLNFLKTQWTPYGADTIDESGNIVNQYVSPFISYYELLAYADQNTSQGTADAMNLMMRTWPHMLTGDTSGTFWENVSLAGAPQLGAYTSLSHGWSAGVVPFLSNVLLGVTPDSGGFGTFTVLPHPASGVTWAEGKVPTPQGDITSAWKQNSAGLSLAVTAPSGTTYTAGVPDASDATVSLNGQVVWADGQATAPNVTDSGGYIQVSGLTGTAALGETR
jgi:hypothetical protein